LSQALSHSSADLYRLGLVDAMAAVAEGRFTARDYVESCIQRATSIEDRVGAFANFDADRVRAQINPHIAATDGRLANMPIGIKDIMATVGVATEMGSAAFRSHIPATSAWVVDKLAAESAIMFGKTVTTEFAWRSPGKTRNPWHLDHTPGGSSSGSAAAVAAGCVPAALGTQTFGSVIRPAAFCGVVGHKPSFGAILRTGIYPFSESLDHVGVFTRSVTDAALLSACLWADNSGSNVPPALADWETPPDQRPRQIALLYTSRWDRASAEQQQLVSDTATLLTKQGAKVTLLELPKSFDAIWDVAVTICDVEGAAVNARFFDEHPPRVSNHILELVRRGKARSAAEYQDAKATQQSLMQQFHELLAPFDAALTAPARGEAPAGLADTGDAVFCIPFSVLGGPAITLPAGTSANGLPLGIQLVQRWGDDQRLIDTARWVEQCLARPLAFPLMP
jgi:Asp-tRNA(Asn)/Glu-tRNA(Gln) amidotransferase A subunit family amidase